MQVSHEDNQAWASVLDLPLAKGFTDLPAFEDAFDTMSLRKFYQEQESTNSQSNFSPRKTSSMTEDLFFGDFEGKDFTASPFSYTNKAYFGSLTNIEDDFQNMFGEPQQFGNDSFFPRRTRSHFIPRPIDNDISPYFSQPFQIIHSKGNIPDNKIQNPLEERTLMNNVTSSFQFSHQAPEIQHRQKEQPLKESLFLNTTSKENEENKRFERLLKGKKIFKIIKPLANNKNTVTNLKAKAGKSDGIPEIAKAKRGLSDSANFGGKLISFNFNLPNKGNSSGQNPGNFVKLIPKGPGPVQNLKNVFSSLQENEHFPINF